VNKSVIRLLPDIEQKVLRCYVEGSNEPDGAEAFYDEIGVPNEAEPPRLNIAVAQILLHHIQETLPQWASVRGDKVSLNRSEHKRHT
jgi:hypothetical protein